MKVIIADRKPSVRHALSVWINETVGWEIVGDTGNSYDLFDKIEQSLPDLIILDNDLPGETTSEIAGRIRRVNKRIAIILLLYESRENNQAAQLDVDFIASKVDPPASILEILKQAKSWLQNEPEMDHD